MKLIVTNLEARYGQAQILFDVSFAVGEGEAVALLGRNDHAALDRRAGRRSQGRDPVPGRGYFVDADP